MTPASARERIDALEPSSPARECLELMASLPGATFTPRFLRSAATTLGPVLSRALQESNSDGDVARLLDPIVRAELLIRTERWELSWRLDAGAAEALSTAPSRDEQRRWAERAVRAVDAFLRSERYGDHETELVLAAAELVKRWDFDCVETGKPLIAASAALRHSNHGTDTEAHLYIERALQVFEKHLGSEHLDVAEALYALAAGMRPAQDSSGEATSHLTRAFSIRSRALPVTDPTVIETALALAEAYLRRRNADGAARALEFVETAMNGLTEVPPALRARTLHDRAWLLHLGGQHQEALDRAAAALHLCQQPRDDTAGAFQWTSTSETLRLLSDIYLASERFEEAGRHLSRGLIEPMTTIGLTPAEVVAGVVDYSRRDDDRRLPFEARLGVYMETLAYGESRLGSDDPALFPVLAALAPATVVVSGYRSADPYYRQLLRVAEKSKPEVLMMSLVLWAKALHREDQAAEAEPLLERALIIAQGQSTPSPANMIQLLDTYTQVLTRLGRSDEAKTMKARADALALDHKDVERLGDIRKGRWLEPIGSVAVAVVEGFVRIAIPLLLIGWWLYSIIW